MARVIVVGIDGCPPDLLRRWLGEGELPTLASLLRRGAMGALRSTPNYQSASAWTSMVTGVNPGKHGIFHFTNPVAGSYDMEQINASARRAPTIWRLLSDAGLRTVALNFPVSYPVESVQGAQVAGWLAPTDASVGFTHPPELAAQLREQFGPYRIQPDVRRHALAGRYDALTQTVVAGVRHKGAVARWLAEREAWDALGVVFVESDSTQHWCWHLIDPAHPDHPAQVPDPDPVLAVYRSIDEELGRLLEVVDDDLNVVVVSDHGQVPNSGAQVFLRGWLREAGYLVPRAERAPRRALGRLLARGFEAVKNIAPNSIKARLRSRLPGLQSRAQQGMSGVVPDWSRTRAWTDLGQIFINTRGRWPEGIVEPGAEYEALLAELSEQLLALEDAETGRPVFEAVSRGDEQLHGPSAPAMPDLLVHARSDLFPRELIWRAPDGRAVRLPKPDRVLPKGAHHPDGTILAAGPDVANTPVDPLSIYDVTPTVLHLLGQPIPSYMDGVVADQLLTDQAARDMRIIDAELPDPVDSGGPSDDDQETVEKRLRGLGYIE